MKYMRVQEEVGIHAVDKLNKLIEERPDLEVEIVAGYETRYGTEVIIAKVTENGNAGG